MESKLNHSQLEAYAKDYAQSIGQTFFESKSHISGKEILNLPGVKQANLFVIKNLFDQWSSEKSKWQSPYFDYENAEVKSAMEVFMNTLSQHINISKEDFLPLLEKAAYQASLLIFSPYHFYTKELNRLGEVSIVDLKNMVKYMKVNRHLLEALIKSVKAENKEVLSQESAFELFNKVCEQIGESPEEVHPYLKNFNEVASLEMSMVYIETENIADKKPEPVAEISYATKIEEEKPKQSTADATSIRPSKINQGETLLDKLNQKSTNGSIKKMISLNQRFMFVKELFKNDTAAFSEAIEIIDRQMSHSEALTLITEQYAKGNSWDMESESVMEFMELVAQKYT